MTGQFTLVLIKPDAVQRGLAGEILARLERKGLRIAGLKLLWVNQALAHKLYAVHEGKSFFEGLVHFITSGPIIAAVLEGNNAMAVVRQAMGATDPAQAAPGTIRGDLALDIGRNVIHGSDSLETAQREIPIFFRKEEILSYRRAVDDWITEGK